VEILKSDEILIVANKQHAVTDYLHKKDTYPYWWVDLKELEQFEFILSDYDTIPGIKSRQDMLQLVKTAFMRIWLWHIPMQNTARKRRWHWEK